MNKFIIVLHGRHVSSNGFDVHQIEAENKAAAREKGHALRSKRHSTFDECAFTVIEIGQGEAVRDPRRDRLTFAERLTGRIDHSLSE